MHVRLNINQLGFELSSHLGNHFAVVIIWLYHQIAPNRSKAGDVAERGRIFRQHESYNRFAGLSCPHRGVVYLEHDIGALGDELRGAPKVESLVAQTWIELPSGIRGRRRALFFISCRRIGKRRE